MLWRAVRITHCARSAPSLSIRQFSFKLRIQDKGGKMVQRVLASLIVLPGALLLARTIPYRGSGHPTRDVSLFTDFSFFVRLRSQLRAEPLNPFNHPQLLDTNTSFGSCNFAPTTQQANVPRYLPLGF